MFGASGFSLLFSAYECTLRSYLCSYLTVSVEKILLKATVRLCQHQGLALHDCEILSQHRNQYYCIMLEFLTSLHVCHTFA